MISVIGRMEVDIEFKKVQKLYKYDGSADYEIQRLAEAADVTV